MSNKRIPNAGPIIAALWSFLQRGGSLILSFISNMVLARILSPEDFGCIGLILVFTSLADTLVDGGLGSALIQKKDVSKQDISTVFTSNLIFSAILFGIVFFAAPSIAEYVRVPKFDLFLRVQSLTILIRTMYVVEFSLLNRNLQFKDLASINIIASLISVVTAITFAVSGFGVWSLIIKNIVLQLTLSILYKCYINTHAIIGFNKKTFSELLNFGGYVSLTYLLDFIYANTASFIMGKHYSVKDLGYYTQAISLEKIPVNTLSMVVNQVMFPYISKFQDDNIRVVLNTRKTVSIITFFIFPTLFFLICFAKPVIVLLYSEKWLPSVPIFQIICFSGLVNALIHANRSVLKSVGRSRLLFLSQVISIPIGLILLFVGLQYSLTVLLLLIVANSYLTYLIVAIFTQITTGYKVWTQISDTFISLIISVVVALTCYIFAKFVELPNFPFLIVMIVIFSTLYLAFHFLFRTKSFRLIKELLLKK